MTNTAIPALDTLMEQGALGTANRQMLEYWQSLRKDGALPARTDFNPGRVRSLLNRLCLFEARPGKSLTCRLAGSMVRQGLGMELSGMDYMDYTPPAYRKQRMEVYTQIIGGLAMCNRRGAITTNGRELIWDELVLPFGDMREDGSCQVLIMADIADLEYHEQAKDAGTVLGAPRSAQFYRI